MADAGGNGSSLSAGSLFAAVGAVASGVGLLAATGLLGRIERDHTVAFSIALGLTVGGTFLLALATSGIFVGEKLSKVATGLRAVGAAAVCGGVIVAVVTAVATASDHGEPVIDVSVNPVKAPGNANAATREVRVGVDAATTSPSLAFGSGRRRHLDERSTHRVAATPSRSAAPDRTQPRGRAAPRTPSGGARRRERLARSEGGARRREVGVPRLGSRNGV